MSKYTIGIDLGGTTMTAGLVDENYDIVGKITWATRLPRPAADLEKALADLCRAVARENKVPFSDIAYVGIGTPGSVNFTTGFVGFNTNFGYHDWPPPSASTLPVVPRATRMPSSSRWEPALAAASS